MSLFGFRPVTPPISSMNLGVASSIILFYLRHPKFGPSRFSTLMDVNEMEIKLSQAKQETKYLCYSFFISFWDQGMGSLWRWSSVHACLPYGLPQFSQTDDGISKHLPQHRCFQGPDAGALPPSLCPWRARSSQAVIKSTQKISWNFLFLRTQDWDLP